jgi:hypothetical protein
MGYDHDSASLLDELERVSEERTFPMQPHIIDGHSQDGLLDKA